MSKLVIFEFTTPYKAFILAKNQEKAIELYRYEVSDYNPAEDDSPIERDEDFTWRMLWNTIGKHSNTVIDAVSQIAQVFSDLNGEEPCVLAIDGALA